MRSRAVAALLVCVAIVGLVVHEAGHALTALALGERIEGIVVMPGIRLHPRLALEPWDGTVASIQHSWPGRPKLAGLSLFMGSGATCLLAWLALAVLAITPDRHPARSLLITTVILFGIDIVAYSVLPQLGLRHWLVIGGRTAEPLVGASLMGISREWFVVALAMHALGLSLGLIAMRRRSEATG